MSLGFAVLQHELAVEFLMFKQMLESCKVRSVSHEEPSPEELQAEYEALGEVKYEDLYIRAIGIVGMDFDRALMKVVNEHYQRLIEVRNCLNGVRYHPGRCLELYTEDVVRAALLDTEDTFVFGDFVKLSVRLKKQPDGTMAISAEVDPGTRKDAVRKPYVPNNL